MKRPIGMTILSLVLGWLAFAGFLNCGVILSEGFPELPRLFGFLALAYGVTAAIACVGLWKMKIWGLSAFRGWLGVCALFFVIFSYVFYDYVLGGYVGLMGFFIFIGVLFWGVHKYVRSKLNAVT